MIKKLNNNLSHLLPSEPVKDDVIDWDNMPIMEVAEITISAHQYIEFLKQTIDNQRIDLEKIRFAYNELHTMHTKLLSDYNELVCKFDENSLYHTS